MACNERVKFMSVAKMVKFRHSDESFIRIFFFEISSIALSLGCDEKFYVY